MQKIKVGLIGCGGISRLHESGLHGQENVEIAAYCDIIRSRAEQRAIHGEAVYEDYRELLKRDDIESVHIMTPHHLHAEMSIAALRSGKYVVCEKPMAISLDDAKAMIAADDGFHLGVIFQNRYNPASKRIKEIISSGALGRPVCARASVTWKRDEAYYSSDAWRGKWSTEGGGVLINQAIHTVDLLIHLMGKPTRIKGSVSTDALEGAIEVEDNAHAVLEFENGERALIYASNNYGLDEPPQIALELEKGSLLLRGDTLFDVNANRIEPLVESTPVDTGAKAVYGNSHSVQLADFYRCVREGLPIVVGGRAAYTAVWAVLGIYESSRSGRWVAFK